MTDAERTLMRQIEEAQREACGEDGDPSAGRWLVVAMVCIFTAVIIWKSFAPDVNPYAWAEARFEMMGPSHSACVTTGRAAATVTIDGGCPRCPVGDMFRW